VAGYSSPASNRLLLAELITGRHELAQLLGAVSYAHYQADAATLAGSPEAVATFLQDLSAQLRPEVESRRWPPHAPLGAMQCLTSDAALMRMSTVWQGNA
jgi:Zn-dependent oligopeptidase